jgi:hypothetical protein
MVQDPFDDLVGNVHFSEMGSNPAGIANKSAPPSVVESGICADLARKALFPDSSTHHQHQRP